MDDAENEILEIFNSLSDDDKIDILLSALEMIED